MKASKNSISSRTNFDRAGDKYSHKIIKVYACNLCEKFDFKMSIIHILDGQYAFVCSKCINKHFVKDIETHYKELLNESKHK